MNATVPKVAKSPGRPKGLPKTGGGSRKGIPNKLTGDVKAMILHALDKVGGPEYLVRQAEANPTAFMTLLGRVIPTQVTGAGDGPLQVQIVRLTGE